MNLKRKYEMLENFPFTNIEIRKFNYSSSDPPLKSYIIDSHYNKAMN